MMTRSQVPGMTFASRSWLVVALALLGCSSHHPAPIKAGGSTGMDSGGAAEQPSGGAAPADGESPEAGAGQQALGGTGAGSGSGGHAEGGAGQTSGGVGEEAGAGGTSISDPCADVVCSSPPATGCQDSTTLRAYAQVGSCQDGACTYQHADVGCAFGCEGGACKPGSCAAVTCGSPPSPSCQDSSTLTSYAQSGTCSDAVCTYAAHDKQCPFGCSDGGCKPDPCAGVVCDHPPPPGCEGSDSKLTYKASGTCQAGICKYASSSQACASNQRCYGAGVCSLCKTHLACGASCSACPVSTPACKSSGASSTCVQCISDGDCGQDAPHCDTSSNSCGPPPAGWGWAERAYLKASNTDAGDYFGGAVALSGDGNTLAVGATGEAADAYGSNGDQSSNELPGSGAVYVFARDGARWRQIAYVKPWIPHEKDFFGSALALSGDGTTLAVGASHNDSAATGINGDETNQDSPDSGAVYIFTRAGNTFVQDAFIKASNTDQFSPVPNDLGDWFGTSLGLSRDGRNLVVGAPLEDSSVNGVNGDGANNLLPASGAAYVFTNDGGVWSQQAYIKASNTFTDNQFGYAVAISGDGGTVVVGSFEDNLLSTDIGGAYYQFKRTNGVWEQWDYVKHPTEPTSTYYATELALNDDGRVLALAAPYEWGSSTGINHYSSDSSAYYSGGVYIYTYSGVFWSRDYIKASNTQSDDRFGSGIALSADGNTLVVGAPGEDSGAVGVGGNQADNGSSASGALYFFSRPDGLTWQQDGYVKTSLHDVDDKLGAAVAISADGSVAVASGMEEDSCAVGVDGNASDNACSNSGAAYLFYR